MTTIEKLWTVLDIIKWSEEFLGGKGIETPKIDAELLLMKVLSLPRIEIYTNFDRPLSKEELAKYKEYIIRRSQREPVQYITGEAFFMGMQFMVNKEVLIPRQDTEILVESVIKTIRAEWESEKLLVIDIGTGSGAIAISLAKLMPQIEVIGLDVSEEALKVANQNGLIHEVTQRVKFIRSDVLRELIHLENDRKVILVSNPPYISNKEHKRLQPEVKDHEPLVALVPQKEELYFYKSIIDQAAMIGTNLAGIFFEVGYNQAGMVKELLEEKYQKAATIKDLGRIERVVYTLIS